MAEPAMMPVPEGDQPQPLADALRRVDRPASEFANRLHACITAADRVSLQRGTHRRAPDAAVEPVFADGEGRFWQPLTDYQGADALDDLDRQMALLARHEPALLAWEAATGHDFAPVATVDHWPEGTLWVTVRAGELAFAAGFAPAQQRAEALAEHDGDSVRPRAVPVPVTLSLVAASLPIADAERIGPGDLLALPAGVVRVRLGIALGARGTTAMECGWHPTEGTLARGTWPQGGERRGMSDSTADGAAPAFQVPLTITLPPVAVPAGEIEALAEGGTIRLMPLAEGLEVELAVAGRSIAAGEIVRLGDSFAVLVDRVIRQPVAEPVPAAAIVPGAE